MEDVKELIREQLINNFEKGDFFFSSPVRTILGKGEYSLRNSEILKQTSSKDITNKVSSLIEEALNTGIENPIVVGAIPFNDKNIASLKVPKFVHINTSPLDLNSLTLPEQEKFTPQIMESTPNQNGYIDNVDKALRSIENGFIQKVVLSRTLRIKTPHIINIHNLLCNLLVHNQSGYTFSVDLTNSKSTNELSSRSVLVGASPELLVSKQGNKVIANPLAGSRKRSNNSFEDDRRGSELMSSSKDIHEHSVVVNQVAEALKPFCDDLHIPELPSLISTETMWHLSTEIVGELKDSNTSSLDLASALHPTPAVCGTPTKRANNLINDLENFERNYFTGMVGWTDSQGDGEWIVTIRCAEVNDQTINLYAGAGVVQESIPEEEFLETSAKLQTMLNALGIKE